MSHVVTFLIVVYPFFSGFNSHNPNNDHEYYEKDSEIELIKSLFAYSKIGTMELIL